MATTYGDTVNAFYLAYYGRPADPAGLAFWTAALEKSKGDFSTIVNTFANSPEATARFASASVSDRVSDIYQQLFGRAPDKAGLDFWVDAIQSGRLSIANAAIEIMHGAQTSDAQTSTLRQQVAAQFTAEVKASGIAYDGDAALQAARVLVSAVNANSKPADLDNLVKAGASLVQTAHDNPAVVKALANGGDLSAVLSTASGKADPVAVVQALASIGKAALTDSAGLNNLLQGGGMAGLLNSLPAGTSVKDVASAVSNGGLSAGAEVANPPPPAPEPVVIKPSIAFVGPDGKDLPADTTLVANSKWYFVAVHNKPAGASVDFQISANGSDGWISVSEDEDLADGNYFIRYVVKDSAGNSGASNALKLAVDHTIPFLNMSLAEDTGTLANDRISSKGAVKIGGLHANETWFYSFDNKTWVQGTADAKGEATIAETGVTGKQSLVVRTLETVNGKSQFTSTQLDYTVDKTAPGQGLKLVSVGGTAGSHTDLAKGDVVFSYTGTIDASKAEALFYQINTNIWSTANNTIVDDVKKTVTFKDVDLSHGPVQIVLQTKDAAGNTLDLSTTVTGQADTTPPAALSIALVADTGASDADHITSNRNIKISGFEAGSTWEYSTNGGSHWAPGLPVGQQTSTSMYLPGTGALSLWARSTDTAGNVSEITKFNYTIEDAPLVTLNVVGNYSSDVTTNSKGLNFQLDLHGRANDLTNTYQMSTTGNADDFKAWDASQKLADGTYYFRAVGTDVAGNAYTTNKLTIHLDNTAPPPPAGVKLKADTGVDGDGITTNGSFVVSGLQKDVLWQYSSDGKTWYVGFIADADGNGIGFAPSTGEQTLQVRTFDLAGNTSDAVSLHFTVDARNPAEGLKLDHIGADGAKGEWHTTLQKADVVFSYTGTIQAGDVLEYTNFYAPGDAVYTKIDSSMIDPVAKTITFHDFDLSGGDAYLSIHATSVAGASITYQQPIDGPYTSYFVGMPYSAAGLGVLLSAQMTAHAYLTDGSNAPVELKTNAEGGNLVNGQSATMIGAQAVAVQGVLGVGNDTAHQTVNNTSIYALGTSGGDTLSGKAVWGFDGNDTINATGNSSYNSAVISGGMGMDTIHTETSSSLLMYGSSQESFLANDGLAAHGFDTVYVNGGASTQFAETFSFEGLKFGDMYKVTGGASFSGNETGTELLAALNTAIGNFFKTGADVQLALINFGADSNGNAVNFLAIDANKDGHITSDDFVVKIVGGVDTTSFSTQNGNGMVFVYTHVVV